MTSWLVGQLVDSSANLLVCWLFACFLAFLTDLSVEYIVWLDGRSVGWFAGWPHRDRDRNSAREKGGGEGGREGDKQTETDRQIGRQACSQLVSQ